MVVPVRIERTTLALSARCSDRLSYGTIFFKTEYFFRCATITPLPYMAGEAGFEPTTHGFEVFKNINLIAVSVFILYIYYIIIF